MQTYAKLAGVDTAVAHPHALKHSCGHQLIDSAGIHRTQAWLGHKSMASTGAYLKPADKDAAEAARKALGAI
jgi:site-specific recombinase XerD